MEDDKQLTQKEIEEYQKQLDKALIKSDYLVKNFIVYIGAYRSGLKAQTSHLTEEEYKMMQDKVKCFNIESLHDFYESLDDKDNYVSKKAIMISKENFAMAFHPMVWKVLTYEERIAAMRIAWQTTQKRDINEFCNHITTTVVFVGKDYKGSLNIASMFTNDSWQILKDICNAENTLKYNYYFNKSLGKTYNKITDFESFEELQYLSPLVPKEQNVEKMSDDLKAYFFNQLERRKMRENYLKANYLILDHSEKIRNLYPNFDNELQEDIDGINLTNQFVANHLGYFQNEIDEKYLEIKVVLFNGPIEDEYNEACKKYNNLADKINEIQKTALELTADLRAKRKEYKEELKNADNMLDISFCRSQIDEINKKINKIYKKVLTKKQLKEKQELTKQLDKLDDEISELKSKIVEEKDAKEYFKEHFNTANKPYSNEYTKAETSKRDDKSEEEYSKEA